jgi:CRISPR-associated protein Cas2
MYLIIVYDVASHRTQKFCDYLRQWLTWRQNSVFEGELTESEFREVKTELKNLIQEGDQVIVYRISGFDFVDVETLGESLEDDRFL